MVPRSVSSPFVVALITARDRPALLRRALASVAAQTRPPDVLLVVDDADAGVHESTRAALATVDGCAAETIALANRRAPGAAGAWNSGLDEVARRFMPQNNVFVAILDDDDWWTPEHLASCIGTSGSEHDVVAADLVRHDDEHTAGRVQSAPTSLSAELALTTNPHIQGSNLFARLSTLLEAGAFDEALASTTDRDLIIRLADLGVRYARSPRATVHHDATSGRARLSSAGSDAKRAGLTAFFRKHRRRMSSAERQCFIDRARDVFGVDVTAPLLADPASVEGGVSEAPLPLGGPLCLVVGIVADASPEGTARVEPLLLDLLGLHADPGLAALDVVVVENGDGAEHLAALISRMRQQGLRCHHVPVERQVADAAAGAFGASFQRRAGRVGIAESRVMVQRYVRWLMRSGAVAWILDDDKRLAPLVLASGEGLVRRQLPVVSTIRQLNALGAGVVLGVDTGAAPLPATVTLRVQLVDLAANLAAMQAHPDGNWSPTVWENAVSAGRARDYYYDVSRRDTAHLETPFFFDAGAHSVSVRGALLAMCARVPRILAGEQVFRPLFIANDTPLEIQPSIHRGGSTLVFDPDALVDVPQLVPAPDGRPSRRSDMVWALLNQDVRRRRVVTAPFAVFHDRSDLGAAAVDLQSIIDDIRGYALYSTLADVLKRCCATSQVIELSDDDAEFARDRFRKYLAERLAALEISLLRARGAARTVLRLVRDESAWWAEDIEVHQALRKVEETAERVLRDVDEQALVGVRVAVESTPQLQVTEYVRRLGDRLVEAAAAPEQRAPRWLTDERAAVAQSQVERLARPQRRLELLGAGQEGVVFTDGVFVFKYFDYWKARDTSPQRAFLGGLVGKWSGTTALYELRDFIEDGPHAILVYDYEPSEPYRGGRCSALVSLLRECRSAGLACRNLKPDNLRVVDGRVVLVDYGSDLLALNGDDWRHMLRRAWLCWRWAHRSDLGELMRRAIHEDVPELDGWQRLARAVDPNDAKLDLDVLLRRQIEASAPQSVLDYGCGTGRLVRDLETPSLRVIGYDVRESSAWAGASVTLTTDRDVAVANSPYDVVVCSLVLCTLDDAAYRSALHDLRRTVRTGGTVVIAVCNPFHTLGGDTALQERRVPRNVDPDSTFSWTKRVRSTGRTRVDVHRPLHVLRRDLIRAGLVVEEVSETETVDLERFEKSSDFLVLRSRAIEPVPAVSLLVRASAMEWRTLEHSVRSLVEQLEKASPFSDRLVVLDSRRTDFARQYDEPDYEAARGALERLVHDGTVDAIVDAPESGPTIAALHERWYGIDATDPHTTDGYPSAASLVGFEACRGDYVLHVDSDILVGRTDASHDVLRELVQALESTERAVCASLNIASTTSRRWSAFGPNGAWRVEARATMLHRSRLQASRPWPNASNGSAPARTWHRALDARILQVNLRSLRGGDRRTFFVHPPNSLKADGDTMRFVAERVAAGIVPASQADRVDAIAEPGDWCLPVRLEPLVVIACGRNVPTGRVLRWKESLEAQVEAGWGVVVVEDGGSRMSQDAVRLAMLDWSERATVFTLPDRRGALANTAAVLRHVVRDPKTIIVIVDLDDALLGAHAFSRVVREFRDGADLTVGGMRRTDKDRVLPVDFDNPRESRGGNVWQHLRAFRRELFDRLPDDALKLDGDYVDRATDWALMLPLVEIAEAPRSIDEALYLHEPSGVGKHGVERERREWVIARLVSMPSLRGTP